MTVPTPAIPANIFADERLTALRNLARALIAEGRTADALPLLEHLETLQADNSETLQLLALAMRTQGLTLQAIDKLIAWKTVAANTEALANEIRALMPSAIERFNDHLAAGRIAEAEAYAAALAALLPGHAGILNSALSCNIALGRRQETARYAAALLELDPSHAGARAALADNEAVAFDQRIAETLSTSENIHPLIVLRDIHDLISAILCRDLTDRSIEQARALLQAARCVDVSMLKGTEWEGWATHYRVAIEATDLTLALAPTPSAMDAQEISFVASSGAPLNWAGVQAAARGVQARTVFFAAADASYVDLYARWYVNSILEHCDVPCLVVLHVIGGAEKLPDIARSVGITSERLIFAADHFDVQQVTTKCYDTPPKGLIARPVAHFQSVRFLRLGTLLRQLKLPVFVSDIDLLLQRGVLDLLERCAGADVVLNENLHSASAGSRYTANLLLVNSTENADVFLRYLQDYLDRALSSTEVTRWIDQFGLMQARHHLSRHGVKPRIDYFDTNTDINNVMYKSYQEHPFRFLSLYHGFDVSSLDPRGSAQRKTSAADTDPCCAQETGGLLTQSAA